MRIEDELLSRFGRAAELALDQHLDDAPAKIGGQENDNCVEQAAQKHRDGRIVALHGLHVEAPGAGEKEDGEDDESHADAAVDDGDRHRGDRLCLGVAFRRAQKVMDGTMHHDDGRRQRHRGDGKPEESEGATAADHKQSDKIGGQQPGHGGIANPSGLFALLQLQPRPQPNGHEAERQHQEIGRDGQRQEIVGLEAEGRQQRERRPDQRKNRDQYDGPSVPVGRSFVGYIENPDFAGMIDLQIGRQQHKTREHAAAPDDDGGRQVSQHDLAQQRRPIEHQERSGTAEHEGADHNGDKKRTGSKLLKPALRRVARQRDDPQAKRTRQTKHQICQSNANRDEKGDDDGNPGNTAVGELDHQYIAGALELRG